MARAVKTKVVGTPTSTGLPEEAARAFIAKLVMLTKRDLMWSQVLLASRRAAVLSDAERQLVAQGIALLMGGRVACPLCGAFGWHVANGHHRVAQATITCSAKGCKKTFKTITKEEIK